MEINYYRVSMLLNMIPRASTADLLMRKGSSQSSRTECLDVNTVGARRAEMNLTTQI